ncbi:uncharacterized protein LOC124258909 [Haliotis rubra]|uniref:uncharacterized protein LOC124258909 n=1 Tax=Haliotis rubra TaxID=36100 RepID=UPI001EE5C9B9|nr:uncharacterized protein LOC124258909 [Haliotis rubra]
MVSPLIVSDQDKPLCPTAPPGENSHPDDGQHTRGQSAECPPERSQSDEGQSEKTPIVAEEESTVDRSRDRLAVGTSAGESVMAETQMTVAEYRIKGRLKELSDAQVQNTGLTINAKNVIVGTQGAIVEQNGTMPTENKFNSLQVDMAYSDSSQTDPKQVDISLSDAATEDCMYEDETEVKQPFIKDKDPKPGRGLQNGHQSLIPSPV